MVGVCTGVGAGVGVRIGVRDGVGRRRVLVAGAARVGVPHEKVVESTSHWLEGAGVPQTAAGNCEMQGVGVGVFA